MHTPVASMQSAGHPVRMWMVLALLLASTEGPPLPFHGAFGAYADAARADVLARAAAARLACQGAGQSVAPPAFTRSAAFKQALLALGSRTLKRRVAEVERMTLVAMAAQDAAAADCGASLTSDEARATVALHEATVVTVTAQFQGWAPGNTRLQDALELAELGTVLLNENRVDEAEPLLVRSVVAHGGVAEAHVALGRIHEQRGDAARALRAYRRATHVDGASVDALESAARLLLEHGSPEDAVREHAALVRLAPRSAGARYNHACALARAGKATDALRQLEVAITLSPAVREQARVDQDLASLRELPGWHAAVGPTPR